MRTLATCISRDRASGVGAWRRFLKEHAYDAIVFLNWDREIAWAARLAGVRRRIGPISKLTSALLLNEGVRQRRSQSVRHEAEYCLELAEILCGKALRAEALPHFFGKKSAAETIVIHPGMGGSAPNWPVERYFEVGRELRRRGRDVVFSVGPADQAVRALATAQDTLWSGSLAELAALLSRASVVLAPSTGPLHLAVALGTPVVSIFPTLPVHESARRWGPFLAARSHVFEVAGPLTSLTAEPVITKIEEFYGSRSISTIARDETSEPPQVF